MIYLRSARLCELVSIPREIHQIRHERVDEKTISTLNNHICYFIPNN